MPLVQSLNLLLPANLHSFLSATPTSQNPINQCIFSIIKFCDLKTDGEMLTSRLNVRKIDYLHGRLKTYNIIAFEVAIKIKHAKSCQHIFHVYVLLFIW